VVTFSYILETGIMDDAPPEVRRASVELELSALADLGLGAAELDLRGYFGHQQRLRRDLAGVCMAWLRGGNTFMLRYALDRSGADTVFRELLAQTRWSMPGIALGHASCHRACGS
jgi:dipeptidase E